MSCHLVSAGENRVERNPYYTDYLDFDVYHIYTSNLEKCIDNPSLEKFDAICETKRKYIRLIYSTGNYRGWENKEDYESDKTDYCLTINFNAINFMIDNYNLNKILSENKIIGKVKENALLSFMDDDFDNFPDVIWIRTTEDEIYYIVADDELDDGSHIFFHRTKFEENGKIYNEAEFKSKYLWNDGSLYINGRLVEGRDNPIFMPGVCRIPIRTVLEELGYKVDYDAKNKAILAEKNNKKYAFILRTFEREDQYISDYPKDVIQVPNIYTYFRNNRFYVKAVGGLGIFFDSLGYKNSNCDIDYINRNYYINTENKV